MSRALPVRYLELCGPVGGEREDKEEEDDWVCEVRSALSVVAEVAGAVAVPRVVDTVTPVAPLTASGRGRAVSAETSVVRRTTIRHLCDAVVAQTGRQVVGAVCGRDVVVVEVVLGRIRAPGGRGLPRERRGYRTPLVVTKVTLVKLLLAVSGRCGRSCGKGCGRRGRSCGARCCGGWGDDLADYNEEETNVCQEMHRSRPGLFRPDIFL
jgi:hypothetical protein